ncbi:hypothetical protein [Chitinophaga polysaccharea]|uniref:hypothetical protein n=1 Tax=Chitinophaga polysaccharea TaxID=1293035 RepID=UPI00115989F3|nr:hypothetical protein [Chitinophaga polysaccharea]
MKPFYYCLALLLVVHGCNKSDSYLSTKVTISEAKQIYNNVNTTFNLENSLGLNDSLPQNIEWETSYERKISGEPCLIVNINPSIKKQINKGNNKYSSNIERYLLFRKDKTGRINFELVTFFANNDENNGLSILIFDNSGKMIRSFVSDGIKLHNTNLEIVHSNNQLARILGGALCIETDWYTCLSFRGISYGCTYNYSTRQCVDMPDNGGNSPIGNPSDPSGGSNFDYNSIPAIRFTRWTVAPPPDKLIADLQKYFGCFNINSTSTYNITLYVKQPIPNSRIVVSDGYGNKLPSSLDLNSLTVGHTFLGFSQSGGSSTPVNRYVGFYPSTMVSPFLPETSGVIADNSNTSYDVSVTFTVSGAQFKTAMDQFSAATKGNYNLNWNNCTDVCISALNIVGLNVPKTIGSWPLGQGANPADLGEDLRRFNSPSIKQKNLTGGTSPSNTIQCK